MDAGTALSKMKSADALERLLGVGGFRDAFDAGQDISPAEGALRGALLDKDKEVREASARLLSRFFAKMKRWNDAGELLAHPRSEVRASAIYGLSAYAGAFDPKSDIPGLLAALDDADYDVRTEAVLFFEKAAAAGQDISAAVPSLKKNAVYGDGRVKEAVSNALKALEAGLGKGTQCRDCLGCEAGLGPGDAKKSLEYMALIIRSISCCGGDVTHRVFRCKSCGQHYVSTYFDHSDFDHGQFSIWALSADQAAAIACELKKCPNPEFRICKCDIHAKYLKDEALPVQGKPRYSAGD